MCGERDRVKEKRETLAKYLQSYCKYMCGERERERETLNAVSSDLQNRISNR